MHVPPKWLTDLGNTGNGVFAVDADQRVLTWNQAAEALLGYSSADAIGRSCHEVVCGRLKSGERMCAAGCAIQKASQRGALVQDFDLLATTAGRERLWLTVSSTSLELNGRPLVLHAVRPSTRQLQRKEAFDEILGALAAVGWTAQAGQSHGDLQTPSARLPRAGVLSVMSDRELEVLGRLTHGDSTEGIATGLNLSILTVRCHIRNMLKKTKLHSRMELVSAAQRDGFGAAPLHVQ